MYSRRIDGRTLTIAPFGWTYDDVFVLYDREAGTLWYPYRKGLKGIQGKYFERWLEKLPSTDTEWGEWQDKHPNSLILE